MLLFTANLCFADDYDDYIEKNFAVPEKDEIQELHGYIEYVEDPQDAIYLDSYNQTKGINITTPQKFAKSGLATKAKPDLSIFNTENIEKASNFNSQEYMIHPTSSSYSGKVGRFTLGTSYSSYLDSAEINYSTNVFSRYEGKRFALTTTFSKSTRSDYASYKDKISIAPEIKLTKRLSLLDVFQTDLSQISKKNELVLRYKPNFRKYADKVQFELGAGQSYYNDAYINSSIRFSTNFKL